MPRLENGRMEHLAQLLFAGKDTYDASRGAGYADDASSFASNARKRANRREVKARVAELQERAAGMAEIDKTFILLWLRDLLEANLADYLEPQGTPGRALSIDDCTPEQILLLNELVRGPKGQIKVKLHDKVAILGLLAKIAGIDRDQTAGALTGIGERLAAALKRVDGSAALDNEVAPSLMLSRDKNGPLD
jgi:hypothetical protein